MKRSAIVFGVMTALVIGVLASEVRAQNLTLRHSPRLQQGIRPLGMGGAFVAVDGSDENALFYNPAAINDLPEDVHMQFVLPSVEFSYKAIPFIASDIPDLADRIDAA